MIQEEKKDFLFTDNAGNSVIVRCPNLETAKHILQSFIQNVSKPNVVVKELGV